MSELRRRTHGRGSRMAAMLLLTVVVGVTGFLAAGAVAGGSDSQATGTLSLRQTKLGQILVNAKGRTLYLFLKDRNGRSSCSGSCASFWPPLMKAGAVTSGPGVKRALVGTTKRANGRLQITYNRHPLYTYALDKRAGQTRGQGSNGFGAKWYAVSAKGRAVVKAPTTTTTTTTDTTTTTTTTYDPYP